MVMFGHSASFAHMDLLQLEEHKRHLIQSTMKEIVRLLGEGRIMPVCPMTVLPPRVSAAFRADVSYLIVGGLGGIGRSICHWMARHGAKNIIVLSRSANTEKVAPLASELGRLGCSIKAMACDICKEDQLAKALRDCQVGMPAIRGVAQGAMVLQDSLVENMTLEDYETAVKPKVQGSWNLHQALAGLELDFFVMLSSLAGVLGQPGQSNYAAGGSYQDALARYRNSLGLPGVSIDLGVILSVGYVIAEHDGTANLMVKSGHTLLSEEDLLKAIESAVRTAMGYDLRFTPLRYRTLHDAAAPGTAKATSSELGAKIGQAAQREEAVGAVVEAITQKLMDIFMMSKSEIDIREGLTDHGVNSLVAVELRNMLALRAGAEVSIFDIMQISSIISLGSLVAARSSHLDASLLPA
ncbi:KR domain-containing protein [Xylariaceae sp. FL0662B]|nr:KR domain-containing protein [Xylariaceae sp. FL0662B]